MAPERDESGGSEAGAGGGAGFDSRGFVERWRRIEPQLRQRVAHFGAKDAGDADEVLSEVALRMIRARVGVDDDRQLLRLADAIARRIFLDRRRTEQRRSGADAAVYEEAPEDNLDAEEAAVLRLTMQEKFASLSRHDRRAVALILRGGPYTAVERVVMYRARPRLREAFEDLLGGAALARPALRRLAEWRSRFSEPHPAVPFLAAATSALTIAGFAVSGASPGTRTEPVPVAAAPIAPSPHDGRAVAQAVTAGPGGRAGAVNGLDAHPPVKPTALGPVPLSASVATRLPRPGQAGTASVSVRTDSIAGEPTPVWARQSVTVNCDSPTRRRACEAVAPLDGS